MTLRIVKDNEFRQKADAEHAITEFRKKIGGDDIMEHSDRIR